MLKFKRLHLILLSIASITIIGLVIQPKLRFTSTIAATPEEQITDAVYLNQEAYQLYQQGQAEDALAKYQQALEIFKQLGAKAGEGNSLNGMGEVYLAQGQTEKAIQLFKQALTIFQELSKLPDADSSYVGYTYQYLGAAYREQRKYEDAKDAYQRALSIFQQLMAKDANNSGLLKSEQISLNALGAISFLNNQYPQALQFYQQILQKPDDLAIEDKAHTFNNLGVIYANLGQYGQALDSYKQALAILRDLARQGGVRYLGEEGAILNNLSALFFSLGDLQQALSNAQQAAAVYTQWLATLPTEAKTNVELLQESIGQSSVIPSFVQQRLANRAPIGESSQSNIGESAIALNLLNLGQILAQEGKLSEARRLAQQALTTYQQFSNPAGQAIALSHLGQIDLKSGNVDQAFTSHQQALTIYQDLGDQAGQAVAYNNIAQLYQQQGENSQAIKLNRQALAIQKQINDLPGIALTLTNLGSLLLQESNITEATVTLQDAIAAWEQLRPGLQDAQKVSLFEQGNIAYQLLQKALIEQNQPNQALIIAERGRARAFAELLATHLDQAQSLDTLNITQISAVAQAQNATLVEYSLISSPNPELYIWVIKPNGEITFRRNSLANFITLKTETQSPTRALTQLVIDSRNSFLGKRPPGETSQRLQQLYQLLIQPIADLLPSDPTQRVIMIPQGALFLIPFPALLSPDNKPLIANHTLLTAPSIQILRLTHQLPKSTAKNALIVGNPTMPSLASSLDATPQPLAPLPGAEAEAHIIGDILGTKPLIGAAATETNVIQQIPEAKIIHLATHGILDYLQYLGDSLPGALAFAPDSQGNGWLTSSEVLNLDFNADLVVLSACNTGRGWLTGDGVIGLSRSFLAMGSRSLIVSLWSVPDQSTALLLPEFYRQLETTSDRAQALRQAMLKTMEQYPAIIDWAGFTLMGEAL